MSAEESPARTSSMIRTRLTEEEEFELVKTNARREVKGKSKISAERFLEQKQKGGKGKARDDQVASQEDDNDDELESSKISTKPRKAQEDRVEMLLIELLKEIRVTKGRKEREYPSDSESESIGDNGDGRKNRNHVSDDGDGQKSRKYNRPRSEEDEDERKALVKILRKQIPNYHGEYGNESSFNEFTSAMDNYLEVANLQESTALRMATAMLKKQALEWWTSHARRFASGSEQRIDSWPKLKKALKAYFLPRVNRAAVKAEYKKLVQNTSVDQYNQEFIRLLAHLPEINEEDKIIDYINGLRPRVQGAIKVQIPDAEYARRTLREVMEAALHVENSLFGPRYQSKKDQPKSKSDRRETALASSDHRNNSRNNNQGREKKLACWICGGEHLKRDCNAHGGRNKDQVKKDITGEKANRVSEDHPDEDNDHHDGDDNGLTVAQTLVSRRTSGNNQCEWTWDTAATCHVTYDCKDLEDFCPTPKPEFIEVGNGAKLLIEGRGIAFLEKDNCTLRLNNVAYVPEMKFKLVSNIVLDDEGYESWTAKGTAIIYNQGQRVMEFKRNERSKEAYALAMAEIWHRRLGHLHYKAMKELPAIVIGMDPTETMKTDDDDLFCEACVKGKHQRLPFYESTNHKSELLERVYSDVCGPWPTRSLGGGRYFVTFIDEAGSFTNLYVIRRKSEVFQKFKVYKAWAENQTGRKIKIHRSDNGGENESSEFRTYLQDAGIQIERTVANTPEQNGKAERMNRTISESVRTMLIDSKLPDFLWGEAAATAVYIRNRVSTRALKGMTPYERFFGRRPDVRNLRAFGCIAYAHVPKQQRHKLNEKAQVLRFVGYGEAFGQKGWRLYDEKRKHIVVSRDVTFNESKMTNPELIEEESLETENPKLQWSLETENPKSQRSPEMENSKLRRSSRIAEKQQREVVW